MFRFFEALQFSEIKLRPELIEALYESLAKNL